MTGEFLIWLETERAKYQHGLEWLHANLRDIGTLSTTGRLESERDNLIHHYQRVIAELDRLIADQKEAQ